MQWEHAAKPRFDLNTYCEHQISSVLAYESPLTFFIGGRLRYFYSTTSPLTLLASSSKLESAQQDVQKYDGLIKDAGRDGYWVTREEKDKYDSAKQRELAGSMFIQMHLQLAGQQVLRARDLTLNKRLQW